jgi:hypothetical protein
MDIDTETLTLRHHNTQYTITIHNLALLAKIDINGGVCMMVPHFGLCSEVDFAGVRGAFVWKGKGASDGPGCDGECWWLYV